MKGILLISIILTCLLGCGNKEEPAEVNSTAETPVVKNYFPVLEYLKSEIRFVDSLPGGIEMIKTLNGKTDSGYISTESFNEIAKEFTPDEIDSSSMVRNFKEEAFFDKSINSATFLYNALKEGLEVQTIHVLSKSDAAYDKVTSIYMEKISSKQDSTIIKKMTWVPGKEFIINQEVQVQGNSPDRSLTGVVWSNWGEVQ